MKEIVAYHEDSFVDFKGCVHKFIVCGVTFTPKAEHETEYVMGWVDENGYIDDGDPDTMGVHRVLQIGTAMCKPNDVYNETWGQNTSYNRAMNVPDQIIVTPSKGALNKDTVQAFLESRAKYIKECPDCIIEGYTKEKKRHEERVEQRETIANFTEEEKVIFEAAKKGIDFSKYIKLAKKLL